VSFLCDFLPISRLFHRLHLLIDVCLCVYDQTALPAATAQQPPSQASTSISTTITMAPSGPITTPFTTLMGIKHPVVLAGMARVSGGELAAAVSNAGGLGIIGGLQYTPDQLREIIAEMKANFARPDLPFGVDLAIPKVGETRGRRIMTTPTASSMSLSTLPLRAAQSCSSVQLGSRRSVSSTSSMRMVCW